tara:strand:- start:313 stop:486 length:174 start_codon:yes stop_codon:yes gene_type:complete
LVSIPLRIYRLRPDQYGANIFYDDMTADTVVQFALVEGVGDVSATAWSISRFDESCG